MMKREAEKKEVEKPQNGVADHPLPSEPSPPRGLSSPSVQERPKLVPAGNETNGNSTHISEELPARSTIHQEHPRNSPKLPADGSQSLLSVLNTAPNEIPPSSGFANLTSSSSDYPLEKSRVVGSRVIPNLAPSKMSPITPSESSPIDLSTTHTPAPPAFNPPPGSRLLAFGTRAPTAGQNTSNLPPGKGFMSADLTIAQLSPPGLSIPNPSRLTATMSGIVPQLQDAAMADSQFGSNTRLHPSESSRASRDFSPLGHPNQTTLPFDDLRESASLGPMNDAIRRAQGATAAERFAFANDTASLYGELGSSGVAFGSTGVFDSSGSHPPDKGGTDGRTAHWTAYARSCSDIFTCRTETGYNLSEWHGHPKAEGRTMDDIFAMLQSSTQHNRLSPQIPQSSRMQIGGGAYGPGHSELQILQQQHLQAQQFVQNNRMDSLYDSRLDDRNFVPDGLVPGLRPAPPRSRSRESSNVLYADQLDDPLHFNVQRLTQQRNLEQMYSGPVPSMYAQQTGMMRNGGMPIQQFRGASPISSQHPLQGPSQRLPPGLANLGGRPPHDPSQYLGSGVGMGGGLHGGIHGSTPAQQVYNNFTAGGLGFGGNPQARGPPVPQNPLSVNAMAGLGPGNVDLRNASHAQLLSMGGANHMGGGMRGSGPGFGPQHGPAGQLPATHVTMRQQQHLPPHMMPQLLPPHLQQQQGLQGGTAQGTQDLMALLMGVIFSPPPVQFLTRGTLRLRYP
ncbi:hypothetical protein A0H81_00698 [Grifola frondosa]|uniref:Uncharacterized protein n=1 Tax=Grifola frondosa TaxID=5627 RepID=A0A1C7MS96_GRIFR|nr:hypothetical protein A0H81_00698 [Grifola frondosa]